MKIPRLNYEPGAALAFYEESLGFLGALCERTWHDRMDIVAEGRPATLWNPEGALHSQELAFAPADATTARDPAREVFPGCPLTFRISELLRPMPVACEKVILREPSQSRLPENAVLERLWQAQNPARRQLHLPAELKPAFHYSLVAIIRCEIQAIDQHWSLHRVAITLPGGEPDEALARQIPLMETGHASGLAPNWPAPTPAPWWDMLKQAILAEIAPDLKHVQARQEQYLKREIRRIDEYFAQYEKELSRRASRSTSAAKMKTGERLEAAKAEHARRRNDQVARHEILLLPHLDALLLTAEPAWRGTVEFEEQRTRRSMNALFVPRIRSWFEST